MTDMKNQETLLDLYRRGDNGEIWRRYCGFLDLSLDEFMASQDRLLKDQLSRWQNSALAKTILGPELPTSVEEFRERAPITRYDDYAEYFIQKREDVLSEKPYTWIHTSGRSGEYEHKWIPYTHDMYEVLSRGTLAVFIVAPCRNHGEIALKEQDRFMFTLAPKPFISGLCMQALHEQFNFRIYPPYEEALKMDFFERVGEGIKMALEHGMDYFYGITSIMLKISEQLEQAGKSSGSSDMRSLLRKPKVLARLLKGMVKAKLAGRPMRPRDLWNVKSIMCSGMDSFIYKERIKKLWGEYPWEAYGCTEFGFVGLQHFAGPGLVPVHETIFFEFMPVASYQQWRQDRGSRPELLRLNEVEAGQEYVLVGTSFHGGALIRYVLGDALKIVSLENKAIDLRLPQFEFSTRVDDVIDIGGFTRLTEKTIWLAIEKSGLDYVDWVVSKEYHQEQPVLHLYLELKQNGHAPDTVTAMIHNRLKELDTPYRDLEEMAGINPLKITLFSKGTFGRYLEERQAAGVDLAHLKPPHINPSQEVLGNLQHMSAWKI